MDLIDIQRLVLAITAGLHPFPIIKMVPIHITDQRGRIRAQLHPVTIRIAMVHAASVFAVNPVFIHHSGNSIRYLTFPEMPVMNLLHRRFLPAIKFPDQRNPGRPGRKCAKHRSMLCQMRTQILIRVKYFSCIKPIKVHKNLLVTNRQSLFRLLL